ncbi:hypothetical protein V6N13_107558 [Hibiscus sabdariffa]
MPTSCRFHSFIQHPLENNPRFFITLCLKGKAIGNLGIVPEKLGIASEQLGISVQKVKKEVTEPGIKLDGTVLELRDGGLKPKGNGSDVGLVTQTHSTSNT